MPANFYQKEWTFMKIKTNRIFQASLIFTIFFFFSFHFTNAQTVVLKGNEPDYKGDEITFYTLSDLISQQEKELSSTVVQEDGNFKCTFALNHTRKIFAELGVYKAYLYVEPGKEYSIALPPKQEKDKAQKLNPYFEHYPFHIGIKNEEEKNLNAHIYRLFEQYNHFFNKNAKKLDNSSFQKDSILNQLNNIPDFDHPFFHVLKKYKIEGVKLKLKGSSFNRKEQLFNDSSIFYYNPSYIETFNTTFQDYFKDFAADYGFSVHREIKNEKNIHRIDSIVKKDKLLENNPQLRELVILKGLHDLFYSGNLPNKDVIATIDSFKTWTENQTHKEIASNISDKITQLLKGYEAPDFCLYDADSNKVCLDDMKGEYIYLGFCNRLNYSCRKHYKILKNLHKKHKQHFRIVIVSTAESFEDMKAFKEEKGYAWTFLHYGNNQKLLKKYNIKTMPTYYFINSEGKLKLSPAPGPDEDIEQRIYNILKRNGDFRPEKKKNQLDF